MAYEVNWGILKFKAALGSIITYKGEFIPFKDQLYSK
jgi:hypothetical protein